MMIHDGEMSWNVSCNVVPHFFWLSWSVTPATRLCGGGIQAVHRGYKPPLHKGYTPTHNWLAPPCKQLISKRETLFASTIDYISR